MENDQHLDCDAKGMMLNSFKNQLNDSGRTQLKNQSDQPTSSDCQNINAKRNPNSKHFSMSISCTLRANIYQEIYRLKCTLAGLHCISQTSPCVTFKLVPVDSLAQLKPPEHLTSIKSIKKTRSSIMQLVSTQNTVKTAVHSSNLQIV